MPRDSNGNASTNPIYLAVPGQTIQAVQHNTPIEDIISMLTGSLARNGAGGMQANLPMNGYRVTGMGAGQAPNEAATVAQATANAVPVGTILDYAGSHLPAGYLWPAGQAVSRTDYADLFAALGTAYGAGDGATTFNLPDLRGRVGVGRDNMSGTAANRLSSATVSPNGTTRGATGGAETHALTTAELAEHGHTFAGNTTSAGAHVHTTQMGTTSGVGGRALEGAGSGNTLTVSSAGAHTHGYSGTTANAGAGAAHNNVQPAIVLNKIIKALNV